MSADFAWEEPPQAQTRSYIVHLPIARRLRANPGKWARITAHTKPERARALAASIRNGHILAYTPKGSFEAVHRLVDGETRVYARFVEGGPDE